MWIRKVVNCKMKPNLIQDIRLFELDVLNVDGNSLPSYIGKIYQYDHRDCLDVIQRLLFLLRHRGFGFEDFHHLYLNFTPCIPHGEARELSRYTIREFSWFQYVDVGCNVELFNGFSLKEKNTFVLEMIKKAVFLKVSQEQQTLFEDTFNDILEGGAELLLPYKKKENQDFIVEIFTRITDELDFLPLIRVTDKDGFIKAEQSLRIYGRDEFISQMGTITIGKSFVRIAPRKICYADFYDLAPIKLKW